MRNGARRLTSLLMALVMVCSLIVTPASAVEEDPVKEPVAEEDPVPQSPDEAPALDGEPAPAADSLPTVILDRSESQIVKYIYADSQYNNLARMPELAGPIHGTLNGSTVELIPDWTTTQTELVCGIKGCVNAWGPNQFSATTFTVKETGQKVQTAANAEKAWLNVYVYGLKAESQTLAETTRTVKKSDIEKLGYDDDWAAALGLPATADIGYTTAEFQGWQKPDGDPQTGQYRIAGWKNGKYYNAAAVTVQMLQALVSEGGTNIVMYPVYADSSIPEWATATNTEWLPPFTLNIVDNEPATVTVSMSGATYGEQLADPTATAVDSSGSPLTGDFTYWYTGTYKTGDYGSTASYSSGDKPTRAGTYKVTATFRNDTYGGVGYSQEFTISPREVSIVGSVTAKDKEYDNSYSVEIDASQAEIIGMVEGDDLHIGGSGAFDGSRKDVGENLPVTMRYGLSGGAKHNYTLKDSLSGQIEIKGTASITRQKVAINDSKITVAKGYDGTVAHGTLGGKLGLHYDYYNLEIDQSGVTVSDYADAAVGTGKTVTLSGIKLLDNGKPATNYQLTTENGTPLERTGAGADETYTYVFHGAEITAKRWPVLDADFTVEFPVNPTYNENAHEVTVTPISPGLGEATVTYAKWVNVQYSPYWQPLEDGEKPTNAGRYQVTVSFAEGGSFAAMEGNNAFVLEENLVIGKATEARDIEVNIAVPDKPGIKQTVFLAEIGLPETVTVDTNGGAYLKEAFEIDGSGDVLASAEGSVGAHYIYVTTKADAAGKSQVLNLVLYSNNYETLNVTATISVGGVEITGVGVNAPGTFEYGTQLQGIIDQQNLKNAIVKLNGVVVSASYISLKDQTKVYDAGSYKDEPIWFTCWVDGREYTTTVPLTFTITKKVIGEDDLDNSSDKNGYYKTIYANVPANASADALVSWLKGEKPNYQTDIWLQESGPNPRLSLYVDSWTKDETVENTAFDPKGTQLPTGVYAWYTYDAALSLEVKYQKNYMISPDLNLQALIRVIPINARQTLTAASAEITTQEAAGLTENNWKAALGLPGQADIKYAPSESNMNILQEAGSFDGSSAPKTYGITGWKMEDGTALTLSGLKKMAAEAAGNREIKLTPVYDSTVPAWATWEKFLPTFTLTIIVPGEGGASVVVKEPYIFEYGTPLKDIIAVNGRGASLADPDKESKIYDAGVYSKETIKIKVNVEGKVEEKDAPIPTFTIVPTSIKSFDSESSAYVQYGYWKTIHANNTSKNAEDKLIGVFPETYTGYYGNGQEIKLTATWTKDETSDFNPEFNPQGTLVVNEQGERGYNWYTYTAHLTLPDGADPKNFNINVEPKGYIKVIPANAYQTISPESKVVAKGTVEVLPDQGWMAMLGLPATADVAYVPVPEEPAAAAYMLAAEPGDAAGTLAEESTAAAYIAAGAPPATAYRLAREAEESTDVEVENGTYAIAGWRMDGEPLTLARLKEKAGEAADGQPVEVALTPVYAPGAVPAWATWEEFLPEFTLIITLEAGNVPGDVQVTAPGDITYGNPLQNPAIAYPAGISESDVTVAYEGMYGTDYGRTEAKPTNAGSYRVVVTLNENPGVRWTSNVFKIEPREIDAGSIKGIICVSEGRPYDGTTNANAVLDVKSAYIKDGILAEDRDKVTISAAIGYFADTVSGGENLDGTGKNAGINKTVVVIGVTLAGSAAGNYKLGSFFRTVPGGEGEEDKEEAVLTFKNGRITRKPLTIDDSGLAVTKAQSEGSWKRAGELKLNGVIGSEIRLDMSDVEVTSGETGVGANKTVTLTGIRLVDTKGEPLASYSLPMANYSLPKSLKEGENNTYTYVFSKAEITAMPRPVLNTDFTVTIPEAAPYDGSARRAVYQAKAAGLGAAAVTYAKRLDDGTYAEPTADGPVNAGAYKVLVSFKKGASFDAAEGQNAIAAGILVIDKAETAAFAKEITVPSAAERVVRLSELDLPPAMGQGVKIKETLEVTGSAILKSVTGSAGRDFFTLETKKVDATQTGQFQITLVSDNYASLTVTIKLTVDTGMPNIIAPKVTVKQDGYFAGGTALKDILELTGGSVTLNGESLAGEFALEEPEMICKAGEYKNHPFKVVFTSGGKRIGTVTVYASFTIVGDGDDGISELNRVYFTIYADSPNNASKDALRAFVQAKKPIHKIEGTEYDAVWTADSTSPSFDRKGSPKTQWGYTWYSYTAALKGSGEQPKAYVLVVPINAALSIGSSTKTLKASDIAALESDAAMKAALGLPDHADVAYTPAETVENPTETFTPANVAWNITGWKMDGADLTLNALKAKARGASSSDVTVTLTPVYDAPAWATVTGSTPTFKLTITPKIPVDVKWAGPVDITYGETLSLGSPTQQGSDIDATNTFTWDYVYYRADGTRLPSQPTDAGTYQVQAVLNSKTHSGASELKKFTIMPKSMDKLSFTPPAGMNLTYNKQPQTPQYTVKDGETPLKSTDYTVTYANNINAGTATVTFTGKGNYTGTKTESFTIQRLALTSAQKPIVSGTAASGQVLSASLSGVDASELEWSWKTDDGTEVGSTPSYAVKPEDSNKVITVTARAKEGGNYSGESGVSDGKRVAIVTVTGVVTITAAGMGDDGKITTGTTLTAKASVTPAGISGAWSWKVNGTRREGAVDSAYTVMEGDKEIIAVFTPNENYRGTIESAKIEVGKALLTGTVSISVTGTDVHSKLTAAVANGPALGEGKKFAYTWLRDGRPISGATGESYTITAEDRGKTISVKVTADGYTGELISEGTVIPAAAPSAPRVTVTAGDGKLIIRWTAPSDNGGMPVIGYELTVTKTGETDTVYSGTLAANMLSYTLGNLTNNTEYTVSVKAVNSRGSGEAGTATGTPKASGGGGGGIGGGGGGIGGGSTTTPDDIKTTVETKEDGTVITTIKDSKGNVIRTEKRPDGSILSTVNHVDGCNGTIETDTEGKTTAVVDVPAAVASRAVDGSAVSLPVVGIWAHSDIEKAPAMVVNTFGVNGVKVHVRVENMSPTVVAVEIKPDGTPVIIKNTIPTKDGIMLRMNHLEVIRFLDNKKSFTDAQNHWAADAVGFVSSRELFNGTAPDTFSPNAEMTRAMLVTVLARYADADTEGGATWYEKGAAWAVANGLSDGTNLNGNITREQLITIMYRYATFEGKLSGTGVDLRDYADADRVSSWAVDAMSWAVGVGLIKGTTQATLDPQGSATRAQVATVIMRYAELFGL